MRDQESTDLEKALAFAVAQRCGCIVLLGATGGRIDHELGNLSALVKYSRKAKITCIDKNGTLMPLDGKVQRGTAGRDDNIAFAADIVRGYNNDGFTVEFEE